MPESAQANSPAPYKVLIVDDDVAHRTLEKEILSSSLYEVSEAENGEQALALINSDSFDVILLDKRMPGMNGDEVCRSIRQNPDYQLIPVIMVTGTNSHEELVLSMSSGASDFIRKPYDPTELIARVNSAVSHKRMIDQLDSAESMLFALARMVEAKDEHTGDHCSRLSHTSVVFGSELGLNEEQLDALRKGGVLHDIGKLGIPDSILLKKGSLSDEEWVLMKEHTVIGARLCSGLKSMASTVPIIRSHHERYDGSGYPDGLKGEDIPLLARIFQIVDIYDALKSERPYKKPFSLEKIISIFEEEMEKGWRDPVLIAKFLDILRNRTHLLELPEAREVDPGEQIFEDIVSTGVMDWLQSEDSDQLS